jgi:hypothetical protein
MTAVVRSNRRDAGGHGDTWDRGATPPDGTPHHGGTALSAQSRLSYLQRVGLLSGLRETVNVILKDLRERNLMETQGRIIRLKNPAVLQPAVC